MTKPKPDVIEYVRQLAALLSLDHWRIDLDPIPAAEDATAQIRVIEGQQRAMLQLGKEYPTLTPDDQRSTILHELIHIFLWPPTETVTHIASVLSRDAYTIFEAAHNLAIERATDALAVAVAGLFPLPKGG